MEFQRHTVKTKLDLSRMLKNLLKAKAVAVDTETTGFDWQNLAYPFSAQFAMEGHSYYVDLQGDIKQEDLVAFLSSDVPKVFHNAKFDLHMLDVPVADPVHDTMLLAWVHDQDRAERGRLRLEVCVKDYLELDSPRADELNEYKKRKRIVNYLQFPPELIIPYGQEDVEHTLLLYKKLMPMVQRKRGSLYEMERRLMWVLLDMEATGYAVDLEYLGGLESKLSGEIEKLKKAGAEYVENMNSPKQLIEYYAGRGVTLANTQLETLENVNHKLARIVVAFRKRQKLLNTYVTNLKDKAFKGRVSCDFRQTTTRSGRLSSTSPNLQNLPASDMSIRKAFINPGERTQLLMIDYDQVELILFAEVAEDEILSAAIRNGDDLHMATARKIFGDGAGSEQRRIAKTCNFLMLYGGRARKLSEQLGIPVHEAEEIVRAFMRGTPGLERLQKRLDEEISKTGGVCNLFGRYRPIAKDKGYIGLNTLIQGTAADVMKRAMLRVHQYLKMYESRLLLTIHDELHIEHCLDEPIIQPIEKLMTKGFPFKLPLSVTTCATATTWADKEELTDEVHLERLMASGLFELPTVDWAKLGCDGLEVESPHLRKPFWVVKQKTDKDRLEVVA